MAQVAYTNGLTINPDLDICGIPLLYSIQDDPVREISVGEIGNVEVKFLQASVVKGTALTDEVGYFIVLLEEGDYDVQIRDPRFEDFDKTVSLWVGSRPGIVNYLLHFVQTSTDWDDLIITPPELRSEFIHGLILTDRFGNPYSDTNIASFIRQAQAKIEMVCDINILYRKIWAGSATPSNPDDYDLLEPGYDYDYRDMNQWDFLKLRRRPLVKPVTDLQLVYPVALSVFRLPVEWIRTYQIAGQVQVVPTAGAINRIFLLPTGQWAPLVSWFLPGQIPQVHQVVYEVGLIDENGKRNRYLSSNVFDLVRHAVGLEAAIEVLGVTGDAILAGVASQSISGDGISESFSTTASATSSTYQARIESYRKDLQGRTANESGLYQKIKDYFSQISMVVC